MAGRTFFGTLRIAILLAILAFVALGAWLDKARSTDWDAPLRVTVYPLAADGDPGTGQFVAGLLAEDFAAAGQFFADEARRHGIALEEPVRLRVSHAAPGLPPAAPSQPGPFGVALWSLKMRYWAWRVAANDPLPTPDIQVFALYHVADGANAVPDSLGLSKGLMAVTHLYAGRDASSSNQVVLVHELLHTLGATDKYDPTTGMPHVPDGLGDPAQDPPYPQRTAEIMAGRIVVGPGEAEIPRGLRETVVGPTTAREIGWLR
ncbi:MAG: hypothetical protein WBO04_04090 [Steroidobacteraceae bacterium]